MREWLGRVEGNRVVLNEKGVIVKKYLEEIPIHFKNVDIDEYIIMPNHLHIIIIIHPQTVGEADLRPLQNTNMDKTKMLLSKIIHGFKGTVTRHLRKQRLPFCWQRSFYEHVIRSEISLTKIRAYIYLNPYKWHTDEYFGREYLMA